MATLAGLIDRFPTVFDAVTQSQYDAVEAEAELLINESKWGALYETGLLYLIAHILIASGVVGGGAGEGASGPISSKSVGDVSISYAVGAGAIAAGSFASTAYGTRYAELRRLVQAGPSVPQMSSYFTP